MELAGHEVPTFFQICGKDPAVMAEAARVVQDQGAFAVDVNMGCPARRVVGKGSGAALMKDPPLAGRIVRAIRSAVSIPLTVKIRSGWDEQSHNAAMLATIAEREGADAVVLHSRSRSSKHSGPPSLDILREVKLAIRIPVIGNGGIFRARQALNMMARSGCDGVMVGRGALGRPWLPGHILERQGDVRHTGNQVFTLFDVIREHFQYQMERWDVITAVRRMRKHLAWYSKGFAGGADFRSRVFREDDPHRVLASVKEFFGESCI